jgi:hypothetical protein
MTDTAKAREVNAPYPHLHLTAALGARLKELAPARGPLILGAKPSPLASLTDLAVRAAADRALREDRNGR